MSLSQYSAHKSFNTWKKKWLMHVWWSWCHIDSHIVINLLSCIKQRQIKKNEVLVILDYMEQITPAVMCKQCDAPAEWKCTAWRACKVKVFCNYRAFSYKWKSPQQLSLSVYSFKPTDVQSSVWRLLPPIPPWHSIQVNTPGIHSDCHGR